MFGLAIEKEKPPTRRKRRADRGSRPDAAGHSSCAYLCRFQWQIGRIASRPGLRKGGVRFGGRAFSAARLKRSSLGGRPKRIFQNGFSFFNWIGFSKTNFDKRIDCQLKVGYQSEIENGF